MATVTHLYSPPLFPLLPPASAVSRPSLRRPPPRPPTAVPYPLPRRATPSTQTTTRRAPSASASTSTTPWPATAGSSAPPPARTASPAPWGRWTSTLSSPPPRGSRWTRSTSRRAPGSSVLPGLLILTGTKVWSSAAPLSQSARRKVRTVQEALALCFQLCFHLFERRN